MKKQYLDYAGLKRVLKRLLPGARKIWHGTEAEWEALSEAERDKYDQAEIIDYAGRTRYPLLDWANAVAVSDSDIIAGYTPPSDGFFVLAYVQSASQTEQFIYVNNVPIAKCLFDGGEDERPGGTAVPVSANDLITGTNAIQFTLAHFVPWKEP